MHTPISSVLTCLSRTAFRMKLKMRKNIWRAMLYEIDLKRKLSSFSDILYEVSFGSFKPKLNSKVQISSEIKVSLGTYLIVD